MRKSNGCTIKTLIVRQPQPTRLRFVPCARRTVVFVFALIIALNANAKSTAIPTGNLIEVLESMAGANFFSRIDLAHKNGVVRIQPDAFRFERRPC